MEPYVDSNGEEIAALSSWFAASLRACVLLAAEVVLMDHRAHGLDLVRGHGLSADAALTQAAGPAPGDATARICHPREARRSSRHQVPPPRLVNGRLTPATRADSSRGQPDARSRERPRWRHPEQCRQLPSGHLGAGRDGPERRRVRWQDAIDSDASARLDGPGRRRMSR
jgi:hypothetical protein